MEKFLIVENDEKFHENKTKKHVKKRKNIVSLRCQ